MTTIPVTSGNTSSGLTLNAGDELLVSSGGVALAIVVSSGGLEAVSSGGTATGTVISGAGSGAVESGGFALDTQVTGYGYGLVGGGFDVSGGLASATSVGYGRSMTVEAGGVAAFTVVSGGGKVLLTAGGTASFTVLSGGGTEMVMAGAAASGTVAAGLYATEEVFSGGVASGAVLSSGGREFLGGPFGYGGPGGGTAIGTTVLSGATEFVNSGGTASQTVVSGGGTQSVNSWGYAADTTVLSGATEIVSFGGRASGTEVGSAGNQFVISYGVVTGTVIESGGYQVLMGGGTALGTTVSNGGTMILLPGGQESGTVALAGGTVLSHGVAVLAGYTVVTAGAGTLSGDTIGSGESEYVLPGGTAVGTQVSNGGIQFVVSSGTAVSTRVGGQYGIELLSSGAVARFTVVSNGGIEVIGAGAAASGSVASSGGIVALASGGSAAGVAVSSGGTFAYSGGSAAGLTIANGASIDLATLWYTGSGTVALNAATDMLTVTQSTSSVQLQLSGDYSGLYWHLSRDSGVDTRVRLDSVPCYCPGTLIATEHGEIAVEHLQVGDRVRTVSGGSAPVVWLGHRDVACHRHPRPHDVWPVRVAAHAFGGGLPRRDLWLSPDHALLVNGVLIPVRYLLNGRTIAQQQRANVSYWHVELARHNAIFAEGLPAESYLDTGNRAAFANGGPGVQLHPDFARQTWQTEACAPLVRGGQDAARVQQALLRQAENLGHALTSDPGLHVLADGRALAAQCENGVWRAGLPAQVRTVRLASRQWVPAHTRCGENDTRTLGVAVGRLWLDGREVSLDSPALCHGWHPPEQGWRWTDGGGEMAADSARELAFTVALTGRYWDNGPVTSRRTCAAPARPAAAASRSGRGRAAR